MSAAPLPPNERERLEILGRYAILDTLPERQYDDLTFLAAQICGTPISLISLVDRDRQWFKSRYGIDAEQTLRDFSFCAHSLLQSGVMEVADARDDPRFAENPMVTGDPNIRYYAGAPLLTPDGFSLGTLCVIDRTPRHLSENQLHALECLARQTVAQLELWRTVKRLEAADFARQQALSHLAANAALLRQFVEHAPAAIAMLDRDLRYIAVSRRFLTDYGLLGRDLIGMRYYDVFPHIPDHWKESHQHVLTGAVERCDVDEFVRPDGIIEFLQWEMRPWRDANGKVGGIIMLTEIISERVRAERLKNEFVSVVSHELRTPLTSIRGALGLLAGGVAGELPPGARQMIDIAQKNSERLVLLINDILDIEKIESGQMRFDFKSLRLRDLLRSALDQHRAYGEALGVRLLLGGAEGQDTLEKGEKSISEAGIPDVEVMGDEGRLQQVLSNLLSNACKFTPSGGAVHLEAEVTGTSVVVRVVDEGPGVPEEFVPRLFERFAQADSSSTRKQGGTGLGLAIARAIVEKHGGHLQYIPPAASPSTNDTPPHGATFAFDLKLAPALSEGVLL